VQACIRAHILRFGVVLNEAAQHEIGVAGVGTLQLLQTLDEVALGNVPEIIFAVRLQVALGLFEMSTSDSFAIELGGHL
jgi:hypothetical protein